MNTVTHNGDTWLIFTELLQKAGRLDAKTANEYADTLGIERSTLPGNKLRKYIRITDVPRLLGKYSRPNPAIEALLSSLESLGYPGYITPLISSDTPDILQSTPANNAGYPGNSTPAFPPATPDKNPGNSGKKHGVPQPCPAKKHGVKWRADWNAWGNAWGEFYASPFAAYFALTALVIAQAWLHASGVWRRIPTLPVWEVLVLTALMQSVVLIGTVNSRRFFGEKSGGYWWFIGGFAVYDVLMGACNFFIGYDPTDLINAVPWPVRIAAITDLGFRVGFSLGFPAATVFFAALVKKIS